MSIEPEILRRVRVSEEPAGSYAVARTIPGDFLDFPYAEGSLQIEGNQTLLDPMAGKIDMDAMSVQVLGPKTCSVNMATVMHSHGLSLSGVTAAPTVSTWALLRVLRAILGGSFARANGGATVTTVNTDETSVEVTTGRGADFAKGGVIGCMVNGQLELREIASISGDLITPKQEFSAPPAIGEPVYGGVTVHMTSDPDTSLQVLVEGRELSDRFLFRGLQGGLTLAISFGAANQLPQFQIQLAGTAWDTLSDGAAVPDAPSYGVFAPVRAVDAELTVPLVNPGGTAGHLRVHQGEIRIELPGLTYEDVGSGAGVEGVRRKRRMPGRPLVRGSFTTPFEDGTWYAAHQNREARAIFQQLGTVPGAAMLISVPTVQIDQPQRVAQGGIAGVQVPFIGRLDEGVDTPTTDAHKSAFRLHFV